jgi:energy-converting hydrogenase Eha subunit A
MWMRPVPDEDTTRIRIPTPVSIALAMTTLVTVVVGIFPNLLAHIGDLANLSHALGG